MKTKKLYLKQLNCNLLVAVFATFIYLNTALINKVRAEIQISETTVGGSILDIPNAKKVSHGTSLSVNSGFTAFSNEGTNLTGIDGGFLYSYALTEKLTVKASFNQAYSISTLTNLYTALGFGLSYNWKGSTQYSKYSVVAGKNDLLIGKEYIEGGLLSSLLLKQYFFSASENVIPLTGLGANTEWHFPSKNDINIYIGGSFDIIFNGELLLTPLKGYAGLTFWF